MSAVLSLGERTLENRTPVGLLQSRAMPSEVAEYTPPTILKPATISNPRDKKTQRPATIYNPPDSPALGRVAECDCNYTLRSEEYSH